MCLEHEQGIEEDLSKHRDVIYMWILKNGKYYIFKTDYKNSFKLVEEFNIGVHFGHGTKESVKKMKSSGLVLKFIDEFNELKTIIDQIDLVTVDCEEVKGVIYG